ncbi:MAG: type II secretion system F family protein [Pirellulales bacterium]
MELLIAESLVSFKKILPFAIFGLFTSAAWWLLESLSMAKLKAEQRLEDYNDPRRRRIREANVVKKESGFRKLLEKAKPLGKPLQPKSEEKRGKLKMELVAAGFRSETAATVYLGCKVAGLAVGLAIAGGVALLTTGVSQDSLIRVIIGGGLGFYLATFVLMFLTKRRKDQIFYGLPDALDLMVVCVEAGLALDQAMRKVTEEMKKTSAVISDEFGLCNFQLQMGRPRSEVLQDLGHRTGVDDLRALATVLIQADKFGSSIADALRTQSDAMRTRRRQLAEEKAAKTAVKLVFPLVLFIFPGIFVVLVGPAAVQMTYEMAKHLGG